MAPTKLDRLLRPILARPQREAALRHARARAEVLILCAQLRRVRISRQISQLTMAERLGCDRRDVAQLEAGRDVLLEGVLAYAKALGVELEVSFAAPDQAEARRAAGASR